MSQRTGRCFAGIGQHQDCGLFELRLGSRISKVCFVYFFGVARLLFRFLQEEMQGSRAVMLRNKVGDPLWQTNFSRQLKSVRNVTGNNFRASRRT